ncbi:MAG: 50S ribosomal protein L23 [Ignavibacteria bacterium]|jgi:large subunit ribosomal protein L23|nr:50S ribosomal protein L23 [Ignavibacteria bacterium]
MLNIIQKPILSEKAMKHTADCRYVFQCVPSANKIEIKKAVEEMFEVKVKSVRTLLVKPKYSQRMTRKGLQRGKTALRKKAYVTLMPGFAIELVGTEVSGE